MGGGGVPPIATAARVLLVLLALLAVFVDQLDHVFVPDSPGIFSEDHGNHPSTAGFSRCDEIEARFSCVAGFYPIGSLKTRQDTVMTADGLAAKLHCLLFEVEIILREFLAQQDAQFGHVPRGGDLTLVRKAGRVAECC